MKTDDPFNQFCDSCLLWISDFQLKKIGKVEKYLYNFKYIKGWIELWSSSTGINFLVLDLYVKATIKESSWKFEKDLEKIQAYESLFDQRWNWKNWK